MGRRDSDGYMSLSSGSAMEEDHIGGFHHRLGERLNCVLITIQHYVITRSQHDASTPPYVLIRTKRIRNPFAQHV